MNWTRLVLITIGAGILTSLTDWFFACDWIHRRYTYPEIWRQGVERKAIVLTSPLPFLTCGFFAYLVARLGLHTVPSALKLAVAVWLIGPLPLILTNAAFMKLHQVFVVSYALGWLTKLVLIGLAVGWFLHNDGKSSAARVLVGGTVRREKALDFSGCNSRPGTGSLHPVAIEAAVEATKLSELSMERVARRLRERAGHNASER